jgi:hypothetical protein
MKRRTLLGAMVSAAAAWPLARLRALAEPRELTSEAIVTLHDLATTVLPSSLGAVRIRETVDKFVLWTRQYREGAVLVHGYGHPRLAKVPPSPVPMYIAQLAALEADARAKGGRWTGLDVETRRTLLDSALTKAGVRELPQRPNGKHVAADLMAFYFRSSEANDLCYSAAIQRQICRPIAVITKRPVPLSQSSARVDLRVDPEAPDAQGRAATRVRPYTVGVVSEDEYAGS